MDNKSNFNQALWLGIGQFCTFAISFISAAILSRYLDKVEYGTYKQILYIYTTLQSLFTLGLPNVFSYFIPRLEPGEQKTFINTMNRIFLFIGALFSLSLFLCSDLIADILGNKELAYGLKLFSPFPLFTLPTMGVEGIYTSIRKTRTIAIYQLTTRILMILCMVVPVMLIGNNYEVAIIGWGVASFITFIIAMYLKRKPYMNVGKEHLGNLYKQVFSYTAPLFGAFIFGFIISSADQFFISRFYGTVAFADYSNGCLSIPIAVMVTSSVKSVLLPLISKAEHNGDIKPALQSYKNAVSKSAVLVFPILFFCFIFSNDIMVFLYGSQYSTSSIYMKSYIVRDFISILPYFSVLMALNMSKTYMNMHIWGAILVWALDWIAVEADMPPYVIVIIRSLFYLFSLIYAFISVYKRTKIRLMTSDIFNSLAIMFLYCCIIGYATYFLCRTVMSDFPSIVILIVSFAMYYILLFIIDKIDKRFNFFGSFSIITDKFKR